MEFFQANIRLEEVFVQLIAFLIVFWTLKKLAWKQLLHALDTRKERIKKDFDDIAKAKQEIETLRTDLNTHLQKIDEDARVKIQAAIEEGRNIAREIQEKARSESQAAFEKSKENLNLEVAKARIALRRDIADLSLQVSEKILKEKMTESVQQEKILGMIEELESVSLKGKES